MRNPPGLAVTVLLLAACGSAREETSAASPPPPAPVAAETGIDLAACNRCHGGRENAAPPHSVRGATSAADPAVGAHQQHLAGLTLSRPLACDECHVVPATTASAGHVDGTAAVVFDGPGSSGLARAGGARPAWNRATGTCSSVYCHGATLAGGLAGEPAWTRVDGTYRRCESCHGMPPPPSSGHPPRIACGECHDTFRPDESGRIVDPAKHIDGRVQLSVGSCTACHGDRDRQPVEIAAAPPGDAAGSAVSPAVGAHQRHLRGGAVAGPVACAECHRVPTDAAHLDGVSRLEWGPVARADAAVPSWDPARATCTNYCHGSTLGDGSRTAPAWSGGPSQATCGSCHGLPPSRRHPAVSDGVAGCVRCHPATARADGSIDVAAGKHVNGRVDTDFTASGCSTCHGSTLAGDDPDGVALAVAPGADAHARHLTTRVARPMRCADCHSAVPTTMDHPDDVVQLGFSGVGGGTAWNGSTWSSYCHGRFPGGSNGGSGTVMSWASTAPLQCTGCHHGTNHRGGDYGDHSGGGECYICHEHVNLQLTGFTDPALHVNGRVEITNCGRCHV